MIAVEVVLYASLSKYHPDGGGSAPFPMKVADGSTTSTLLDLLGSPAGEIKQFFVKNKRQDLDYILMDGDRVAVFPPVGGG
jgi:sulfur carrier protein ThiS